MSVRTVRVRFLVCLLVISLVIGQSNALFAQSKAPATVVTSLAVPVSTARATPAPVAGTKAAMPASQPKSPQGSSKSMNTGLLIGLALSGTGAALLAKKEPVHQTICITYDSCPVPGIVHMTGGLMLGIGVPLTILKLVKH